MLSLPGDSKVYVCQEPMDLRKGFEGLGTIVHLTFGIDVTSGAYFVFLNRRKDRMKVLYWDGDGLVIWYKRLERGCFLYGQSKNPLITRREFLMILEGITPKRLQKRYSIS